jgi:hypothetical protein
MNPGNSRGIRTEEQAYLVNHYRFDCENHEGNQHLHRDTDSRTQKRA